MNGIHAPRRIAFSMLALMLAILLAGLAATPAHAEDNRTPQVNAANQYIADCMSSGGDPDVTVDEANGFTIVSCSYEENYTYCFFYYDGTTSCGHDNYANTAPLPGRHPLIGADTPILVADLATNDGSMLPILASDASALLINSPSGSEKQRRVMAPTSGQEQEQDTSQGKKGKKGKKGAKGRRK